MKIILKSVLSKDTCELLTSYAHFKSAIKPNKKKDRLKNVHREYSDLMMETLLTKLTPVIEEATGLELWPTLSFYYVYTHGTQLDKHKDRSSCQIVAGLYVGADDEFKQNNGDWPLILNSNGQPDPVHLEVGDMVIFNGHETEHWRETFTGTWFVSAIFGYVDKQGPFAFQKFDQRRSLGRQHVGMFNWSYGCIKNQLKQCSSIFFDKIRGA